MRLLQRTLRHCSRFSPSVRRAQVRIGGLHMRRLGWLGVSCLTLVAVGCGSGNKSGTGGNGSGGDGYIFDPCVSEPKPGYDPAARDLPTCCEDGPAHCVPSSEILPALA